MHRFAAHPKGQEFLHQHPRFDPHLEKCGHARPYAFLGNVRAQTTADGQHAWPVEGVSGPSAARTATGRLYCARRKSASPVAPCSGLQVAQSRRAVICCSAACLPQLDRLPRFGVEVFLNALWISSARRLAVVRWDGVESPSKSSKHGLVQGITGDLGMLRDILQTVGIKTAAQQIMRLRRQRVRP